MPLGVAGFEAALAWANPDLQQAAWFGAGGVELAVGDAAAGAHELDLAGAQHAAVAHAVFVLERAIEDVAEDFHVAVRMGGEAGTWGDDILIDNAEAAEAHVGGIIIICEGEGVVAVEPAVLGMAAFGGFAKGEFHGLGGGVGDAACDREEGCM